MTDQPVAEERPLTEEDVRAALDAIVWMQVAVSELEAERKKAEAAAMPAEVRAALDEIAEEFEPRLSDSRKRLADTQDAIRQAVISLGHSVKGVGMQAVFMKGRVSWDTKALDGYCAAHPEIAHLRSEGNPSVSMRIVAVKSEDMAPTGGKTS